MVNKFIGVGHLCDDPKMQEFGNNKKCSFSLAMNNTKTEALFLNIECWNNVAENCYKFLKKGSCSYVEGKVKSSKWQDKAGVQRTSFFISADMVRFLPSGKKEEPEKVEKPNIDSTISNIVQELEEPPF